MTLRNMKFNELRLKIGENGLFSFEDTFKWFPDAKRNTVKNQLSDWVKKGYLLRLKRNFYLLKEKGVKEEFVLANRLYQPSYVSLESALNYYGLIPDVPLAVTSVSLKKTQSFKNRFGLFLYRALKPDLFFGWQEVESNQGVFFKIATQEKALFDYLYLNQNSFGENFPEEERFSLGKDFNWKLLRKYSMRVKNKNLRRLVKKIQP